MVSDVELIVRQAREHQALTETQLQRDGRVYDAILKRWITRPAHAARPFEETSE